MNSAMTNVISVKNIINCPECDYNFRVHKQLYSYYISVCVLCYLIRNILTTLFIDNLNIFHLLYQFSCTIYVSIVLFICPICDYYCSTRMCVTTHKQCSNQNVSVCESCYLIMTILMYFSLEKLINIPPLYITCSLYVSTVHILCPVCDYHSSRRRYTRKVYTNLIFPTSASSHVTYFAPPSNVNISYIPKFKQKNIFFELILDNG